MDVHMQVSGERQRGDVPVQRHATTGDLPPAVAASAPDGMIRNDDSIGLRAA